MASLHPTIIAARAPNASRTARALPPPVLAVAGRRLRCRERRADVAAAAAATGAPAAQAAAAPAPVAAGAKEHCTASAAPALPALPSAVVVCPGFLTGADGAACAELSANLSAYLNEQHALRQRALAEAAAAAGTPGPSNGGNGRDGGNGGGGARGPAPPRVEVLQVEKSDWYPTLRGASFGWYAEALADAVGRLFAAEEAPGAGGGGNGGGGGGGSGGGAGVALVCLSAAGWIARLALGSRPYEGRVFGLAPRVSCLVTLGTPHFSLEAYPFGRVPERRLGEGAPLPAAAAGSSLQLANLWYPDAASVAPTRVVTVVGTAVEGSRASLPQRAADVAAGRAPLGAALEEWVAAVSYEATCGRPDAVGDGVTPRDSALLPGARHVLLPGVRHAPSGQGAKALKWYGSASVVPLWAAYLAGDAPPQ